MDVPTAVCRLPGCGGPSSSVCINGLAFDECPNVRPEAEVEVTSGSSEPAPDVVSTGRSAALSLAEADAFLRSDGGTLLAVIAGPDVGKTTLIATIYELARRGGLQGLGFAGSETIRGLEERCFLSRAASERDEADTQRTPTGVGVVFVHLRLALPGGRRMNLLLSDRSGEHFDDAVDEPGRFGEFVELRRADGILLLLDAERLERSHHAEIANVRKLMLAMSHAELLTGRAIHLVITKADRLDGEARFAVVNQRAQALVDEFGRRFSSVVVRLHFTFCRAAAGSSTFGRGVGELVIANVPAEIPRRFVTKLFSPTGGGGTALDRLMHAVSAQ